MSVLSWLRGDRAEQRGADPTAPWGNTTPPTNGSLGSPVAGITVNERTALGVAATWACNTLLADAVATLPIKQYSGRGTNLVEIDPAPVVADPSAEMTIQDWLTQSMMSMTLRGNVYGRIVERDKNLYATQIMPAHPDQVTVKRNSDKRVEYRFGGDLVPIDDVFHIPGPRMPGSLVGMNPIEMLRNSFGLARAADMYGAAFFSNSAMPSGVIQVAEDLNENETKALMQSWLQAHQGISASNLPAVLTGGATWQSISLTPDDAQFIQSRTFSRSEVAMIYRIPPHMIGDVDRTTSWGCLPGDSLVFTTHGPVPIAEVNVGDEVWAFADTGMRPAKVTGWQMTGMKPLMTFHTRGRTVRATSNHHMWIRRYFGRAQGRAKGSCRWETIMVNASEVRTGDYLMVPHGLEPGVRTLAPNGRELTADAMELCGLYLGDGSRDKGRIEIAHAVDEDHMPYYRRSIQSEFGVVPYVDGRGTRTRFSSPDAIDLFSDFFGTALTKRVPGWVFRLTPELQLALLRGFLDSDGSVQHGAIIYSSAHRRLLEDIRHLCMQVGIPVGRVVLGRHAGKGSIRGREFDAQDKWQLSLTDLPSNARVGSNSPRKASRLRTGRPHHRVGRYDKNYAGVDNNQQGIAFDWPHADVKMHRITRIEKGQIAVPVYDIEVEGPATFVADGVIVGNTGIEQQELMFVRTTLAGYLKRFETAFSRLLPPGQFVRFDLSERLRGDTMQRYQGYAIGRNWGWLTINDILRAEGLPTIGPEGDERMVPVNMMDLDQMGVPNGKPNSPNPASPSDVAPPGKAETKTITRIVDRDDIGRITGFEDVA